MAAWVVLLACVLSGDLHGQTFPQSLSIANPEAVGSGARARALGNAFVALADDATAANWNPAGLSQLTRPEFSFAIDGFTRRDSTHAAFPSEDNYDLAAFNYASFVYPLRLFDRNAVVSLSYINQYRFDRDFNGLFQQRLIHTDTSGTTYDFDYTGRARSKAEGDLTSITPAFGIDVTDKLALGFAINLWHDGLTRNSSFSRHTWGENQSLATEISVFGTTIASYTDTYDDVLEIDRYKVESGFSFVIGGLYRLNRSVSIGVVVKPGFTLDLDRHAATFGYDVDRDVRLPSKLEFPWEVAVGTAVRPNDQLTVAADLTWTQWSQFRMQTDGQDVNPISGRSINRPDDVIAARLGLEYVVVRDSFLLPLRCGTGYVPTPSADGKDDYYTLSCGAGIQLGDRWNVDLAYEYRWGNNVNKSTTSTADADARQDVKRHGIMASLIYYF